MPNLVRIGPTVWISIPDTQTHKHTHPDSTLYIRLRIHSLRIPLQASLLVKINVFVKDNRKDQICPFFINYESVKLYNTGQKIEKICPFFGRVSQKTKLYPKYQNAE